MKKAPRIDDLPIAQVEALESGDLEQVQEVIDKLFERRESETTFKKIKTAVVFLIRTIAAPFVSELAARIIIWLPMFLYGVLARPLGDITILKVVIIIAIASFMIGGIYMWFAAAFTAPGLLLKMIAPKIRWLRITLALIVFSALTLQFLYLIYTVGARGWQAVYLTVSCLLVEAGILFHAFRKD